MCQAAQKPSSHFSPKAMESDAEAGGVDSESIAGLTQARHGHAPGAGGGGVDTRR